MKHRGARAPACEVPSGPGSQADAWFVAESALIRGLGLAKGQASARVPGPEGTPHAESVRHECMDYEGTQ